MKEQRESLKAQKQVSAEDHPLRPKSVGIGASTSNSKPTTMDRSGDSHAVMKRQTLFHLFLLK